MDPTPSELQSIVSIDTACAWVGIQDGAAGPFKSDFLKHLGGPTLLRQIAAIPADVWKAAVAALKVTDGEETTRTLSPVEIGQAGTLRRIARLALGLPGDEAAPSRPDAQGPAGSAVGTQPGQDQRGDRNICISKVLDQGDDTEIVPMPQPEIQDLIQQWKQLVNDGEDPAEEVEATGDQLSALGARLKSGLTPFADFGVWRPFGARFGRQLKFLAHFPSPGGGWKTRELNGPPSFKEWIRSWQVFAFGMEVHSAAARTRLERYSARIAKLDMQYPDMWWIIGMADIRCRSEHLERIRRLLAAEHAAGRFLSYDPRKPWDIVFREAARDQDFWTEHVDKKAMRFCTRLATDRQLQDDGCGPIEEADTWVGGSGHTHRQGGSGGGGGAGGGSSGGTSNRGGGGKRTRAKRRGLVAALASPSPARKAQRAGPPRKQADARAKDGKYFRDSTDRQICWEWNRPGAGCKEICPNRRAHCCEWCRSTDHRSSKCSKAPSADGS